MTDKESSGGEFGGVLDQSKLLPIICKYHHGKMIKEDLISYLKKAGLSQNRIDDILLKHRPAYVNPYAFYYLAGLVPLLYVLVSYLAKGKKKSYDMQQ